MGFRAGRGIADITGEAAECGMLGYGKADQQSAGIHTRRRARASNNPRRGGSYLTVERRGDDGSWTRIADDGDWSTLFRWARSGGATSVATVTWIIPPDTPPGSYRIAYHGDSATKGPFTGVSEPFQVR